MTQPSGQRGMRRAIVILPGAFTSGNLFFGIWSIVEAARGDFIRASWLIVVAAIMDTLDGRIARMSRTGTQFGAEMDSLVDAISFGVAPALLVYFHTFGGREWSWVLCFLYILAAVLRLARFNIEQAGHAKSQFFGLPSPAAGMTLATYFPFTQTPFFRDHLAGIWAWNTALAFVVVGIALLMVSHVPYPVWPKLGLKTWRGVLGIAYSLAVLAAAIWVPAYFFFPYGIAYATFGIARAVFLGLQDRLPERDLLRDEDEDDSRQVDDEIAPQLLPFRVRKGHHKTGGTA